MDVAVALTLAAAGGFFFLDLNNAFKYRIAREDANRLTWHVAAAAVILFSVAFVFHAIGLQFSGFAAADHVLVVWLSPLMKDHAGADAQAEVVITAMLSLALGPGLALVSNRFVDQEEALANAVKHDDLERLLREAVVAAKPISITLSNGKVYVGFVMSTFDPRIDRRMITMLPLASGYRTPTGTVAFTTYYDEIYRQLPAAGAGDVEPGPTIPEVTAPVPLAAGPNPDLVGMTLEDFRIVLPVDKAVGIGFFDLKIYSLFGAIAADIDTTGAAALPAGHERSMTEETG